MRTKLLLGGTFAAFLGAVAWAQSPGVNSPWNPVWSIPIDSIKRTYSYANQLSPVGFATDIMTLCGANGVTTKLTRLMIAGRATAVSPMDVWLLKRSNWDTLAATQASTVGVPYDASDSASQSAVTLYTALPTNLGTLVGVIGVVQKYVGNLTTGVPNESSWAFTYAANANKAPTLRSATQCLAVNLSGTSQGGNLLDIYAEWTEE